MKVSPSNNSSKWLKKSSKNSISIKLSTSIPLPTIKTLSMKLLSCVTPVSLNKMIKLKKPKRFCKSLSKTTLTVPIKDTFNLEKSITEFKPLKHSIQVSTKHLEVSKIHSKTSLLNNKPKETSLKLMQVLLRFV